MVIHYAYTIRFSFGCALKAHYSEHASIVLSILFNLAKSASIHKEIAIVTSVFQIYNQFG